MTVDYYAELELPRDASQIDIRKAYRRLCLMHHPDKQPSTSSQPADSTRFLKLQSAYETLSDPVKKAAYDDALRTGRPFSDGTSSRAHPNGFNPFDPFFDSDDNDDTDDPFDDPFLRSFFHSAPNGRARPAPRKSPTSHVPVQVTLEELYERKKKRLGVTRTRPCDLCKGSGARKGVEPRSCVTCKGTGKTFASMYHGAFMSRVPVDCSSCNGKGVRYRTQDACKRCQGARTTLEKGVIVVDVTFENLSRNCLLLGEGDHLPGHEPGDIEISLKVLPHDTFTLSTSRTPGDPRMSSDLSTTVRLTLSESIFGLDRVIVNTLDGRQLRTSLPRPDAPNWQYISTEDSIVIPGEGVPTHDGKKGDLVCRVEVDEPTIDEARAMWDEQKKRPFFAPGKDDLGGGETVHSHVAKRVRRA